MAEEREILLYGPIGPSWLGMIDDRSVIAALDEMKDSRRIHVRINSEGGDVFAGISIANAFRRHSAKIIAHVDALAASAASIIAMGADRIVMHPSSMMMVHRAWTIAAGNTEEMEKVAATLAKVDESIVDSYHQKTGLDKAKLKKLMAEETWMSADEAVEMGFADEADASPVSAQAKIPQGWYAKVPDGIERYNLDRHRNTTGLSIAASAKKDIDAERRAQFQRTFGRLKLA